MAVVKMSKIRILLHQEDKIKMLDFLQEKGMMQILETSPATVETGAKTHKIAYQLAELEFTLKFLEPYSPKHSGMDKFILGDKVKINSFSEVDFVKQNFDFQKVVNECKRLEEEINLLQNQQAEAKLNLVELLPWKKLDFNLEQARNTQTTHLFIGTIHTKLFDECVTELTKIYPTLELLELSREGDLVHFWILVEKNKAEEFEKILNKFEFKEFLPVIQKGTPTQAITSLQAEIQKIQKELKILNKERKHLAQKAPELKIIYDYLFWQKEQEIIKTQLEETKETSQITGFVPTKELESLQKDLNQISNAVFIEELPLKTGEKPPVALKNKNFVKPFEGVLKLFGMPASSEADPTPYLTPFFLVFFGFCLTDFGYGLILGLGLLILLKVVKFPKEMKQMLTLLMYAGWVTMFMGILFGGYMGLTIEQAPSWMVNPATNRFKFQVFDPVNNIYAVMAFAYGLGLIQLWLGTLLKGLQQAKTSLWEAIQASFSYNLLVVILIFYSLAKANLFLPEYADVMLKLLYINAIFAIWGIAYTTKNIFARPILGVILFLQEIIGIFSGVLSYSRLFALGLSTGIIALVFNTIALTAFDLLPIFIGIPAMVLIIIAGHLLNIALNVLGAFIHSARLQLVEFFGKFFEGGGEEFMPFKKEMKYISLSKD